MVDFLSFRSSQEEETMIGKFVLSILMMRGSTCFLEWTFFTFTFTLASG